VQYVENVQPIVPIKQDNKVATTISAVQKSNAAIVGKDAVEEAEPLNGLNMELKKVYGDACMQADRGQLKEHFLSFVC
jgi:hypothetical protein